MDIPKIALVLEGLPDLIRYSALIRELDKHKILIRTIVILTNLKEEITYSHSLLKNYNLRQPDYTFNYMDRDLYSSTKFISYIMKQFEEVCSGENPQLVLIAGDNDSAVASCLVAKRLKIKIGHIDSGLRSGNKSDVKECNNVIVDNLSDFLLVFNKEDKRVLMKENFMGNTIHIVGNIIIDSFISQLSLINEYPNNVIPYSYIKIKENFPEKYLCLILSKYLSYNDSVVMNRILSSISEIFTKIPIIFFCSNKEQSKLKKSENYSFLFKDIKNVKKAKNGVFLIDVEEYNDRLYFWKDSIGVITDGDYIQMETTYLNIPCFTLKESSKYSITVTKGTNSLVGLSSFRLKMGVEDILDNNIEKKKKPEYWDGKASKRVMPVLKRYGIF